MPLAFLRRRRFLAGLVALGALSPSALAKEKLTCHLEAQPQNSRVSFVKGGVYHDGSSQKRTSQRQVACIKPFDPEVASHLGEGDFEAMIGYYVMDMGSFRQRWLRFQVRHGVVQCCYTKKKTASRQSI